MLLWASKLATAEIECSFEMGKLTPMGVTFIFACTHKDTFSQVNLLSLPQNYIAKYNNWDSRVGSVPLGVDSCQVPALDDAALQRALLVVVVQRHLHLAPHRHRVVAPARTHRRHALAPGLRGK